MYGVEWLIGLGVLGLLAGLGGGYLLARRMWGGSARLKELEAEAQASRQELDDYRQEVVKQFSETAHKFQALNDSYTDLHQHLARSSSILCGDVSGPLLAAPSGHQDLIPGSARGAEGSGKPSARSGKEPSAGLGKEPSAGLGKEPSAGLGKEPSAGPGEKSSASPGEKPSAGPGKEPSKNAGQEPSAPPGKAPSAGAQSAAAPGTPAPAKPSSSAPEPVSPASGKPASGKRSAASAGATVGEPGGAEGSSSNRRDGAGRSAAAPESTATAPDTGRSTLAERLEASTAARPPAAPTADTAGEDEEPPVLRDVQAAAPTRARAEEGAGDDIFVPEPRDAANAEAQAVRERSGHASGEQSRRKPAAEGTAAGMGQGKDGGADQPEEPADRQARGARG